jgi:hypothetical protein
MKRVHLKVTTAGRSARTTRVVAVARPDGQSDRSTCHILSLGNVRS